MASKGNPPSAHLLQAETSPDANGASTSVTRRSSISKLRWLDDVLYVTLTEFAYYIDSKGELTLYYVVLQPNTLKYLSVLQVQPNGLLRCIRADMLAEEFKADHAGYHNTTSKVFTDNSNSQQEEDQNVFGYVERRVHIRDSKENVIFLIYSDKSKGNESPYFIKRPGDLQQLAAKIATVSTHRCLMLVFHESLNSSEKAMIICLARKVYRQYYKQDLKDLNLYNGQKDLFRPLLLSFRTGLPLTIEKISSTWQQNVFNYRDFQMADEETRKPPEFDMLADFCIQYTGFTLQTKASYFTVKEKLNGIPVLIMDCRIAENLYGHVRFADTLEKLFYIDNLTLFEARSRVFYKEQLFGYLEENRMFDSEYKTVFHARPHSIPNDRRHRYAFTIFECNTDDGLAQAILSFHEIDRYLSLTTRSGMAFEKKIFMLAFAMKMLYGVCKMQNDTVTEYSSIEEMIDKI